MTLTHFDDAGSSRMVDVAAKPETKRTAIALASIRMKPETLEIIQNRKLSKGDVIEVARLAGIMACKRTSDLIPLCHPLPLTHISMEFESILPDTLTIQAKVETIGRTGVEMEALTAVTVSALTVYDMAKAVDRGMTIEQIRLVEKTGGKSGDFRQG
jgi:cyclic pyranopterin monophosphate synthase